MAKRQHWMDEVKESLRGRISELIPSTAQALHDDVPFGYTPKNADDEVRAFLNMTPEERQQLVHSLGPDEYGKWADSMMGKLTTRFGSAAQSLMPMLQGAPIEALANTVPSDDGGLGVAAAQADLASLLGYDPFAE